MQVTGLDPSLSAFGATVAWPRQPKLTQVYTWKPKTRGHERLNELIWHVREVCSRANLVVIEGLSFGSKGSAVTDLAGLHWLIRHDLWLNAIPYAVIPPPVHKKWITGRGNASKEDCLIQAIKRFPDYEIRNNNEADAVVMAAMGCAHLGIPLARMPASSDEQLAKVTWPDLREDMREWVTSASRESSQGETGTG